MKGVSRIMFKIECVSRVMSQTRMCEGCLKDNVQDRVCSQGIVPDGECVNGVSRIMSEIEFVRRVMSQTERVWRVSPG